ncbi:MAG: regulatory protein RecX [Anaerolineales bacterium]
MTRVTAFVFMNGLITALQPTRRGRVRVYLDGEPGLELAKELARELELGKQLGAQQVSELLARDRKESAYRQALKLLARRPHTERELRMQFDRSGLSEVEQEDVMDSLRRAKLVSDADFAAAWLENRMAFRPRGAWALRVELRARGVPAEVIETALTGFDEEQAALQAARLGLRKYEHLSPELFRQRLNAYLQRRGFQHPTIEALVERLAVEREVERKDLT